MKTTNVTAKFIDRAAAAIHGSADDLRAKGFAVAVHNDYRLNEVPMTFWLLTIPMDGIVRAFKGEGKTDAEALDQIRGAYAKATDHLHHAPMCPANHYEGMRPPHGPCSCGAVELSKQ